MPWTFYDRYGQKRVTSSAILTPAQVLFDAQVARGQAGDPATGAVIIDSNTILGGNIPQTWKHLQIVASLRTAIASSTDNVLLRFNNDSGANYDFLGAYHQNATGAAIFSGFAVAGAGLGYAPGSTIRAARFGAHIVEIPSYADAVREKHCASKFGFVDASATSSTGGVIESAWRNTAAITRVQLLNSSGLAFADGSRVTLYGMP
jgi:hypothetical protein